MDDGTWKDPYWISTSYKELTQSNSKTALSYDAIENFYVYVIYSIHPQLRLNLEGG